MSSMENKIKSKWNNIPLTVKVSAAYAICSILQRCLSFITMPIFVRLLTTEQYGMYVVYQSWNSILSIFITLNLAFGSFSKAMIKFEKDREGYIASVEGMCLVLAALFLVIYLPFRDLWNGLFELPTSIMLLMVGEILGSTAILLWSGKKRFEFKYKCVVAVTLIMSVLSPVLAYILVINSEDKGYARIFGYSIVIILMGLFFFGLNLFRGKRLFNKEYWKYGLTFNLPLLAYYLSQYVFNQSDRIMIDHLVNRDKAAIYGVAYSLAMVLTFIINATNNSYIPWFYLKIKDGKAFENKKVSLIISGMMAILLCGVVWFAPEIIAIIGGEEYVEAVFVIPPVAISLLMLFYAQMFICVEFYYEKKKRLVIASVVAALLNIILNWIFIPKFGYIAAAYTTLFSYIVFAFANYLAMKSILKELSLEDNAYDYFKMIMVFIALIVCSVLGIVLYSYVIARLIVALIVLIVLIIKRKTLYDYYVMVFKSKKGKTSSGDDLNVE